MKMNGSGCVFDHYGKVPESVYDPDSFTSPIEEAVYNRDLKTLKLKLQDDHPICVRLKIGQMTCFEYAAMSGDAEILAALVEESKNASILKKYFSLDDVVERAYLISKNKKIFFDEDGLAEANRYEASLFTAVEYNQPKCVDTMLKYLGCREPSKHNFFTKEDILENLTPTELAQVRGHTECCGLLTKCYLKSAD